MYSVSVLKHYVARLAGIVGEVQAQARNWPEYSAGNGGSLESSMAFQAADPRAASTELPTNFIPLVLLSSGLQSGWTPRPAPFSGPKVAA